MTPLHQIGELLRSGLSSIPLPVVRLFFVAVPLVVLVWILRLPQWRTTAEPAGSWSANLKLWAAIALAIQIAVYSLL